MDYTGAIAYLYDRLPVFTRDGASAYKKDIGNIKVLCEALGNPQMRFRSIHVAGTNGKGSSSHMLAAILSQSGYRTGLYTSPHLVEFRERIRIDGTMIPEQDVIDFIQQHRDLIERVKPSFFEVTVALAFLYFAEENVDIAVIETGLGGRLDSTNIIYPVLSLITNIGFDHKDLLGETLEAIAAEKAGIIKDHTPVVISEYQEIIAHVFREKARQEHAPLVFAERIKSSKTTYKDTVHQEILVRDLHSGKRKSYSLDLLGSYQSKNLLGVIESVEILRKQGFEISDSNLDMGLSNVQALTELRGRWQILSTSPVLVCDTGHNEDGWREILSNIALNPHKELHMVIGVMGDKDLDQMLPLLPVNARYYFCQVNMPRALPAKELAEKALHFGFRGISYSSVAQAVQAAREKAQPEDMIFVGGSTFIVGEFLEKL